jgi:non-ribosomal peptide synthase protein (TIGR01720 family)
VSATGQALTTSELRHFLGQKLPQYMVPSAFVMLEALPLTPSGKVDRQALPAPEGIRPELERPFVAPRTPVEEAMASIWGRALGIEQVGIHDNFFDLGGDSILIIQVIAKASQMGLYLTPRQLFEHQTIAELAGAVDATPAVQSEQGLVTGPVPLLPVQHWFFEHRPPNIDHYNWGLLFEVKQPLDPTLLEKAVARLFLHHDGLRLRFEHTATGWRQMNVGPEKVTPFIHLDLSALPEAERRIALSGAAAELQTSLSLSAGPVMRAIFFDFGQQERSRLLILPHHAVMDGISYRVLMEDLETAYHQLSRGEAIQLSSKTTSFRQWSERLTEYARSKKPERELDYWLAEPRGQIPPLPVDYSGGDNTMASTQIVGASLGADETQALLRKVPQAYQTQINTVLLTALARALAQWTGERLFLVEMDGHGREELFEGVDLSRTLGWFTSLFPVLLDLREAKGLGTGLKSVKEQLSRMPHRGINYGVLRYLSESAEIGEVLQALPPPQVSFNYVGQLDAHLSASRLFGLASEPCGPHRDPCMLRNCLLDVNVHIVEGQLHVTWTYSENLHRRSTVESVAQAFIEALQALIAHCLSRQTEEDDVSEAVTTQAIGVNRLADPV